MKPFLSILYFFGITTGFVFKFKHLPGANLIIIISLTLYGINYFLLKDKQEKTDSFKISPIFNLLIIYTISVFMAISHWPYSGIIMSASAGLIVGYSLSYILYARLTDLSILAFSIGIILSIDSFYSFKSNRLIPNNLAIILTTCIAMTLIRYKINKRIQ